MTSFDVNGTFILHTSKFTLLSFPLANNCKQMDIIRCPFVQLNEPAMPDNPERGVLNILARSNEQSMNELLS
jgi:hypothetical protein